MNPAEAYVWNEILDEFRSLGGTADNITLREGPLGRGLFSIDAGRPFRLRVPESLLIEVGDVVFENGMLKIGPNSKAGARERNFLEDYYARLAWGAGGREEIGRIFEEGAALPAELREALDTKYHCGGWFQNPTAERIERQFVDSREFDYHGRDVLMPVADLANHGPACRYDSKNGIALNGTVSGEITARYTETDTFGIFRSWGFVSESAVALSVELEGAMESLRLRIERRSDDTRDDESPWVPARADGNGIVTLSFLVLGHREQPGLARSVFRSLFRKARLGDADEAFDKVWRANLQHFLALLEDLEPLDGPMARSLRRMARLQIQTMAYCFG
jgi:hypothetical protein